MLLMKHVAQHMIEVSAAGSSISVHVQKWKLELYFATHRNRRRDGERGRHAGQGRSARNREGSAPQP
jgi:hypothetical protein